MTPMVDPFPDHDFDQYIYNKIKQTWPFTLNHCPQSVMNLYWAWLSTAMKISWWLIAWRWSSRWEIDGGMHSESGEGWWSDVLRAKRPAVVFLVPSTGATLNQPVHARSPWCLHKHNGIETLTDMVVHGDFVLRTQKNQTKGKTQSHHHMDLGCQQHCGRCWSIIVILFPVAI